VITDLGMLPSVDTSTGSTRAAATYEDYLPVWSPNGRYVAFTRETGDSSDSVYIVSVKSGQQRRLVASGSSPSWSPDGTRIAYDDIDVMTIKLNRTGRKRAAIDGSFPRWSPDGGNISFERVGDGLNFQVFVVPADGGKARRVTSDGSSAEWSPDGTRLVFVTGEGTFGRQAGISVVGRDGKGIRTLSWGEDPSWSPDGRKIAFTRVVEDEEDRVYVMRNDGGNVRLLAVGEGPEFSPDGKWIAYSGEDGSIWRIDRDGLHLKRLTRSSSGGLDFNHAWSPDGRFLSYQRGSRIWIVRSDGTHARQLTH
jgi:Tol biopolymer transport system component